MQHLVRAADGHRAAVERVALHLARQLRQTGDARDVVHLVDHDRIDDVGGDAEGLCQKQRQHAAEVRRVRALPAGVHEVHHRLIDAVGTGGAVRHLSAAGADRVKRVGVDVVVGQRLFDRGAAEVHLLHDPAEGRELLGAVAQRRVKELLLALKDGDFRGGGAGVDDQYAVVHVGCCQTGGASGRSFLS